MAVRFDQGGAIELSQTLLKALLVQRHWQHYETFAVQFRRAAAELGALQNDRQLETLDISRRQLERWTSGALNSLPRPRQSRVLEHLFGLPVAQLLAAPLENQPAPLSDGLRAASLTEKLEQSSRLATDFLIYTDIGNGPHLVDQLYGQLRALAQSWVRRPASTFLEDLMLTQRLVFSALQRERVPSRLRDLYFLGALASGLMGKASQDIGQIDAALTHVRTALFCADNAAHSGMTAWLRGLESLVLFWSGDTHTAANRAEEAAARLEPGHGSVSAWLPALQARALAVLGDGRGMQDAIEASDRALEFASRDDLDAIGGLLSFPKAKALYYASEAIVLHGSTNPRHNDAMCSKAAEAVKAFDEADPSERAFSDEAGAYATLALAQAKNGDPEAAEDALRPVMTMEASSRIHGVVRSFQRVECVLMSDAYRRDRQAAELVEKIGLFTKGNGMAVTLPAVRNSVN